MSRAKRATLALGFLVTAGLLAAGAYVAKTPPPPDLAPHPFNQDRNAVWLEHRWLERPQPVQAMESLLNTLAARGVRYVYPHLIPFDKSGQLPPYSRDQMAAFLDAARRVAPGMKVLPWIGGVRVGYKRMRPGTIDLSDLGQRQRIVAECRGLIDEGFDGVHLNVEPVDDGNVEFLALLRAVRTAVGPEAVLSLAAIKPAPLVLPGARNFMWSAEYYRRLAAVADQIVIMAYDTGLPTSALYQRYTSYAAHFMTTTLGPHEHAHVLLGVPTYDETGLMHRSGVETIDNALLGIVKGLRGKPYGGTFEGIAIYAEWTTDPQEWAVYEKRWRGGAKPVTPGETADSGSGAVHLQIAR